jgi:hypothetical protein
MMPLFSGAGDHAPFSVDWRNKENGLIYQVNGAKAEGGKQSAKMNFAKPDAINTALLNKILWRDRMGSAPMPAPRHTVLPDSKAHDDD